MKKALRLLLTLTMLLVLVAALGVSASAATEVATTDALTTAVNAGGEVKLTADITLTSTLTVANGKTVTIDLNGHVLKAPSNNRAITVNMSGKLTLTDSKHDDPTAVHYYTFHPQDVWVFNDDATDAQKTSATPLADVTTSTANNTLVKVTGGAITGGYITGSYNGYMGGAIVCKNGGTLSVTDVNFIGNKVNTNRYRSYNSDQDYGHGGAIATQGNTTLTNCSFLSNQASCRAGAIYANSNRNVSITGCTFMFNRSNDYGGACYFGGSGTVAVTNTTAYGNYATGGGGFIESDGKIQLICCTITNNSANNKEGAVSGYISLIQDCTITGNRSNTSSNTYFASCCAVRSNISVTLKGKVVITGNTNSGSNPANLYLKKGLTLTVDTTTPLTTGASVGVTMETAPTANNPVAITGNNGANDYKQYFTSDNASYTVVRSGSTTATVNKLAVPVAQIGSEKFASVQDAVNFAANGDTVQMIANSTENVTIPSGKTVTLDLNGKVLKGTGSGSVITNNGTLTVKDSKHGDTTVKHYFNSTNGVWSWNNDKSQTANYVTGGVITGGKNTSAGETYYGNGVANKGMLTIDGVNIIGNSTGNWGGGLLSEGGTVTVRNSLIAHNYSLWCAGVGIRESGTYTFENTEISGNQSQYEGGGFYTENASATLTNCTVSGNSSGSNGGGLYLKNNASVTMTGGSITGNNAVDSNGAAYFSGTSCALTLNNVGVTGNKAASDAGGIKVENGHTLTLGGTTTVTGNKVGNTVSNVYLASGKTVTVSDTPLTTGANIGVTLQNTTGNVTAASNANYSGHFTSDKAGYLPYNSGTDSSQQVNIGNPKAKIVETDVFYDSVQLAVNATTAANKTVQMVADSTENITIANTQNITLDLNGKVLKGTGSGSVITNNGTLTVKDSDTSAVHYFNYQKTAAWTLNTTANSGISVSAITGSTTDNTIVKVTGGCITGGNSASGGGIFNSVGATLTLKSGTIVGNKVNLTTPTDDPNGFGGGVFTKGSFTMSGGTILGNLARCGGAVAIYNGTDNNTKKSEFNMTAGMITRNYAAGLGGGIGANGKFSISGGTISYNTAANAGAISTWAYSESGDINSTITGGTISNNTATVDGGCGGIFLNSDNQKCYNLQITGGTISNNTATGNGGYGGLYYGNKNTLSLVLGGTAKITGNKVGNTVSNLYLPSGKTVIVSGNQLTGTAEIGVTLQNTTGAVTAGSSDDYSGYFKSDNANYRAYNSGTGSSQQVNIGNPVAVNTTTNVYYFSIQDALNNAAASGQTVRMLCNRTEENIQAPKDKSVTLDLNGYVLKGGDNGGHKDQDGGYSVVYVPSENSTLNITDSNPTAVHYYTVGQNGIWTWNDNNTANAVDYTSLTTTPTAGTVIRLAGGAITGGTKGVKRCCQTTSGSTTQGGGIFVAGKFTMTGGNIVGNHSEDWGGGISVNCQSTQFKLTKVNICGNTAKYVAGGICYCGKAGMELDGCTVSYNADDNTTGIYASGMIISLNTNICSDDSISIKNSKFRGNTHSAAVHINFKGTASIENTEFLYNTHAATNTGGSTIDICGESPVTFKNCTVKNNTNGNSQNSGAVWLQNNASSLTLAGTTVITDNVGGNLYLASGGTALVDSGAPLTGAAKIRVKTANVPAAGSPVAITGSNSADYSSYFVSDDASYKIYNAGSGESQVVKLSAHEHVWTYKADGATLKKWCCETFGTCNDQHNTEASAYSVTISAPDSSLVYDGGAKSAGLASSTQLGDETMPTIAYQKKTGDSWGSTGTTAPTDAGTYRASITAGGATAYVDFVIAKRPVTLTSASDAKKYNGNPLTNSTVTTTSGSFVSGEVTGITATGTITAAGEVTNAISYTPTASFKESNYQIIKVEGTLVVTEGEIVVTGKSYSGTYDGNAHGEAAQVFYTGTVQSVETVTYYTSDSDTGPWTVWSGSGAPTITDVGTLWVKAYAYNENCDPKYDERIYSLTVTAAPLVVTTVGSSKVYDGSALTASGNSITGLVTGETATITPTGTQTGAGSSNNTYTIDWGATESTNYSISDSLGTLMVTPKALTVTGTTVANKEYDGNITATATLGTVDGKVSGDDVTVTATAEFADANADTGKTVTVTYSISGTAAGNYTKPVNDILSADITKKTLTITGTTVADKVYDGEAAATATLGTVTGYKTGDDVTVSTLASFADAGAGEGKTVTVVYLLGGTAKGNYTAPANEVLTANIDKKALTVSGTIAAEKVYDGTVVATASIGSVTGVVGSDDVSVTVKSAAFADANVGEGKSVTVNYELTGAHKDYYTTQDSAVVTADITRKSIEGATVTGIEESYVCTGSAIHPTAATVVIDTLSATHTESYPGTGYQLVGDGYEVTITGTGNFTGSVTKTFAIAPKSSAITVDTIVDQYYTGSEIEPTVTVKDYESNTLIKDTDYIIYYENNTAVGTASVVVTGINGYDTLGPVQKEFNIVKAKVALPTAVSGLVYNGEEQTGVALPANAAYELSDNTATDAGDHTATATLCDKDNYVWDLATPTTEDQTIDFTIAQLEATLLWTEPDDLVYDKTEKVPTVEVSNRKMYDEVEVTAAVTTGKDNVNVGKFTFTASELSNANYKLPANVTSPEYTITAKEIALEWSMLDAEELVYSNTAKMLTATATELESEDTCDVTVGLTAGKDNVNVGKFTFTASALSNPNYALPTDVTSDEYAITAKPATAKWTVISKVYTGGGLTPTAELVGLCSGDESVTVTFDANNTKTAAGSYQLTAGLGSNNYALTNPYVNFVIEKAPVSFTVTNDSHQYDGSAKSASVTASPSVSFTVVYKNGEGETVANPKEVGSYGIYATLDANHRFADSSDGAARKVGTLTIHGGTAPATYTVSFAGGVGATGNTSALAAVKAGETQILPTCGFVKSGWAFAGWKYGSKIYRAGESFTQPYANVKMTAEWTQNVYSVGGIVRDGGEALENAVVTLMSGARQIQQKITDVNGAFSFDSVLPGLYNLVTSYDGTVVTTAVVISDANVSDIEINLPYGRTNSVVEVTAGTPEVVVAGLDESFTVRAGGNYTQADKTIVEDGGSVEFKLTVSENSAPAQAKQEELAKKSPNDFVYLDMNLTKTVLDKNGVKDTAKSGALYSTDELLEITIPIPTNIQGKDSYQMYRYHTPDGSTAKETLAQMKQLSGTAAPTEEGYRVSADKKIITVFTKSFSLYAISYTEYSDDGGSIGAVTAKTETQKCPQDETCVYAKFTDAKTTEWYHDGVHYCVEKGYMNGMTATQFAPSGTLSRAMIVTMLWRIEGSPAADYAMSFTDVATDFWYTDAIRWAQSTGIVTGYSDTSFGPEDNVTREQLAAILCRYAKHKGIDTANKADLAAFKDTATISSWALESVKWANAVGIINGRTETTIAPAGNATRAEAANMVQRFCEKVLK